MLMLANCPEEDKVWLSQGGDTIPTIQPVIALVNIDVLHFASPSLVLHKSMCHSSATSFIQG